MIPIVVIWRRGQIAVQMAHSNERARALLAVQMAAMASSPPESDPAQAAPLLDVSVDTVRYPAVRGGIRGVTVGSDGSTYVCTQTSVHKITPGGVLLIAGCPDEEGLADGAGPDARFRSPRGLTSDRNGCLLVAGRTILSLARQSFPLLQQILSRRFG